MKQSIFLTFFAILFVVAGCKHDTEIYTIYRDSKKYNYKTLQGAESYAFAAKKDSVLVRADYYLKMMGQLKTYGSKIVAYGFCWNTDSAKVFVNVDSLRTTYKNPLPGEKDSALWFTFSGALTRLSKNTTYFVRSYIITIGSKSSTDSVIWYNPLIRKTATKPASDQWFEQFGNLRPTGQRFGALAFNFGDTVFFGTGDKSQNDVTNDIQMYDPVKKAWDPNVIALPKIQLPAPNFSYLSGFCDGIGFAIQFNDINSPSTTKNKFIYVGLGDYFGKDLGDDKSNRLLALDLNNIKGGWTETHTLDKRSNSVCFVIDQYAYIGTGSNTAPVDDWHVFNPAKDRDNNSFTPSFVKLLNFPKIKRVGAVAFTINGRGYFGLGMDDKGNFLNDFYQFRPSGEVGKPEKGTWETKASFPGTPRANASAFVIGDQGYVGTGDNFKPIVAGTKVDIESDPPNYTGDMFEDVWRYDPYNNKWFKVANYTQNNEDRKNMLKKVTHGVGFSIQADNSGFIGFGIVPTIPRVQEDLWQYKPYDVGKK